MTGFPAAIETVFPKTQIQLCIVHLVRNPLHYVSWKHRKSVAADLRKIYTALNAAEAVQALVDFAESWDNLYPTISKSWLCHWQQVIPFFAFPLDIRKAIYTTNAIESRYGYQIYLAPKRPIQRQHGKFVLPINSEIVSMVLMQETIFSLAG